MTAHQGMLQSICKQRSIGQICEPIVKGAMGQHLLGTFTFRYSRLTITNLE